jgi:hypothetical protein
MCDYSLHHVSSRPAKVADKLVTMKIANSSTRGFAAVGELGAKLVIHDSPPGMAVCLLPGTELAFDDDVQYDRAFSFLGKARVKHKVASFRQVDVNDPYVQHDALEFPNGQVLKIRQLVAGQTATVLQLPVVAHHHDHVEHRTAPRAVTSRRLVMNRVAAKPGLASMLMPSQGTVMLWQTLRTAATKFSVTLGQSFCPRPVDVGTSDTGLEDGFPAVALSKPPPVQKPEKTRVRAAG